MRADIALGRIGLRAEEVAETLGINRRTWDDMWKREQAPQPIRLSSRLLLWSRDEIRAWAAHGFSPYEDWRRIWNRMLEKGTWGMADVEYSRRAETGDAA